MTKDIIHGIQIPQEFTIQKSVFQHPRFNRRRIATMILLYLALSLVSLPLCSASCSEAVQEVCQEVITENNDQLLETMGEMVADRSCDTSNMIQKAHLDQLYQKMANLVSG